MWQNNSCYQSWKTACWLHGHFQSQPQSGFSLQWVCCCSFYPPSHSLKLTSRLVNYFEIITTTRDLFFPATMHSSSIKFYLKSIRILLKAWAILWGQLSRCWVQLVAAYFHLMPVVSTGMTLQSSSSLAFHPPHLFPPSQQHDWAGLRAAITKPGTSHHFSSLPL